VHVGVHRFEQVLWQEAEVLEVVVPVTVKAVTDALHLILVLKQIAKVRFESNF
jgi:hypothetical protein